MISKVTVDQVKAYPDIVGVISDYVSLRKRGRNFIGLCPFHSEKTPSFTVSPDKQLWHCFGCHSSGDHIGFIMKVDNLTFVEAISHIAHKAGIVIVEEEKSFELSLDERRRQQLLEVLSIARDYFRASLPNSEGSRYLLSRGLTQKTIDHFSLGYAPTQWDPKSVFANHSVEDSLLQKAGLAVVLDDGAVKPRFRQRVVFPVLDHRGRTVGFGARLIQDRPDSPKYVNTEETILFNKRRLLYGLDKAKTAIRDKGRAIVMEGYMDVIVAHQFGFDESIASMGTALTTDHAQTLRRFTDTVYLAMDSDAAGQQSIERSYEALKQAGFQVSVIELGAKDPADVLLQKGAGYFQDCIEKALPIVQFKFARVLTRYDATKIEHVPAILQEMTPLLQQEKDAVVQKYYVRLIAKTLKIDEELVMAKIKKTSYNVRQVLSLPLKNKKDKFHKAQEYLLFFIATNLELREKILAQVTAEDFILPDYVALVRDISLSRLVDKFLVESLSSDPLRLILSRVLIEGESEGIALTIKSDQWEDCIHTLKSFKRESRIQDIKKQLKVLGSEGDDEGGDLLEELKLLIRDE